MKNAYKMKTKGYNSYKSARTVADEDYKKTGKFDQVVKKGDKYFIEDYDKNKPHLNDALETKEQAENYVKDLKAQGVKDPYYIELDEKDTMGENGRLKYAVYTSDPRY